MKILKKLTPYAKMSLVLGKTEKYEKGQVDIDDNVANEVYNSMIATIKLDQTDVEVVALRNNYVVDRIYPQYEPDSDETFHVTVDDKVYICLSNNNGAISTSPPSGSLLNNIIKSDGYVWAYIGKLNDKDVSSSLSKFITIPTSEYSSNEIGCIARINAVKSTTTNFDTTPLYKVITKTGSNAIFDISLNESGDINYISCANGGFGYRENDYLVISDNFNGTGAEVNLKVNQNGGIELVDFSNGSGYNDCSILVIGDGTGASLEYATLNGSVTDVTVKNEGSNYTWAKAFVFSSDRAIIANLQLLPMNGKATSPSILLRANTWRIKKSIDSNNYDGYIYNNMEFNYLAVTDQYTNAQVLAGLNNKYNGNIQLKYATEVKEVYSFNKTDSIVVTEDEKINLIITIKVDG